MLPAEEQDTAYRRFQRAHRSYLALGFLVSVALHLVLFLLVPQFHAGDLEASGSGMTAIDLPPQVEIPPPPERIARPATPTVAEAEVSEEVTIAPTTFEANPADRLPPPPKARGSSPLDRPTFIPHDVAPRLENRAEFQKLLRRFYPSALRDAGIGGKVTVWVYVDASGQVERAVLESSSGYDALDEAALKVARRMVFKPALSHDNAIGVWVSQRIVFQVVD